MNKGKKIVFDMFLNIVATAIPTFVLQLIILPLISGKMESQNYGLLVTILALLNIVPSTMGNVLNNIRLLYDEKYKDSKLTGDFNIILIILSVLNLFVVSIFTFYYQKSINFIDLTFILLVSVLWLLREYFIVAFRIKLNYLAILVCNILMVLGYGLGYVLFLTSGKWQFIYILGHTVSLVYICAKCRLWKEPLKITPFFRRTSFDSFILLLSNLMNRVLTYADKLLIFPILGGSIVSVYYAATIFGKVVSLMITPITGVALSYLSKYKKKSDKLFKYSFLFGAVFCALGYVFCVLISKPVLSVIYPQFVDDAMNYIFITTGTTVLYALISIINPFILKFFDMKWQLISNTGTVAVYIILCMTLLHFFGLTGFCIGALLSNLFRLVFLLTVYSFCKQKS